MTNKVKVEIYGDEYLISGDADSGYISRISSLVDERMRELGVQNKSFSKTRLAILTAVNLADELIQLKENPDFPGAFEEKAKRLISMLDEGIIGDY